MHCTLPENVQTRICHAGTKLGTKFSTIKDPAKKSHQHNVVCNWIRTHNHLDHKRTLNHLAKLAK